MKNNRKTLQSRDYPWTNFKEMPCHLNESALVCKAHWQDSHVGQKFKTFPGNNKVRQPKLKAKKQFVFPGQVEFANVTTGVVYDFEPSYLQGENVFG